MLEFTRNTSREGEILEVVLRRGWDYMRRLLSGSKTDEPEPPPPEVLRSILVDLGPVYVKLGQLLSTRPDLLSPEYIAALSELQSGVPPVPPAEIERFIRQQMPQPVTEVFSEFNYQAIAAGSIGQTHRAKLKNGRDVAVKVQRPGIENLVARDVAIIQYIAKLVSATNFGQRYNIVALAEEFSRAIQAELDFSQEASYTDQLRQNLSKSQWFDPSLIVVPEIIWELTTSNIMVMEWLQGKPLLTAEVQASAAGQELNERRSEISQLLFRAFFQQYLIDGFFHADPHPGNLFYLDDGRVAILDCGMMGTLDPRTRTTLTEMILAIVSTDAQRCTQLTLRLAEPMQPIDLIQLESDYRRLLRRYYGLSLANLNSAEAFSEILQAASRNNLRWPSNIGLFTKSLLNLEGAGRQFDPSVNLLDEAKPLMVDLFRQQLVGNDPVQALLRTALEFKELSLESPRQFGFLLNRLSTETLKWKIDIQGLEDLRRSIDDAANRRSFSTLVASLVIGAAIVTTGQQTTQIQLLSNVLFAVASLVGLWLMISIIRSGRLR
ncbi:AarF/ABC1/UbiB kinase family protein [Leptolyngbya sp. CCY15150]|uniref:ABC1 kinase family protein n=1 Tax=Leptolyngbya sp. CCY15150 TaxID=2767772 RepID=UPI0031BB1B1D